MTRIAIEGDKFVVDGTPPHRGREFLGTSIEGALFNTRMVQAIFDDENPETESRWAYPDTGVWDPERNVREFIEALSVYREHGIDAVTIHLQGGMPVANSMIVQPWQNSTFTPEGELKPEYLDRLRRVIDAADDHGMVVIVGYFYVGQSRLLADEAAVFRATENATRWLLETGRENILVEIANEIDVPLFPHDVLSTARVPELIQCAQSITNDGRRLLTSASFTWFPFSQDADLEVDLDPEGFEFFAKMADASVDHIIRASDFILFHTNLLDAEQVGTAIDAVRGHPAVTARGIPVLINEDGTSVASLEVSASRGIGWGYYDQGGGERLRRRISVTAGQLEPLDGRQARLLRAGEGDHGRLIGASRRIRLPPLHARAPHRAARPVPFVVHSPFGRPRCLNSDADLRNKLGAHCRSLFVLRSVIGGNSEVLAPTFHRRE